MACADDRSVVENEAEISAELQRMMDAHVPHAMSKQRHDLPWLTPELKRECRRKQRDSRLTGPGFQPIGLLTITVDGVLKLLRELNPKKASGPDKVPCFILKELAAELAPAYTHLFSQSLDTGIIPPSWL